MTCQIRHEYERACAYLGSFQSCMFSLEQLGVGELWMSAMRADVARLTRSLQAAVDDLERRTESGPTGWSAREHSPPTAVEVWSADLADAPDSQTPLRG
jgi:hypothetical protein